MSYDPPRPVGRLLLTPEDKEAPDRTLRLRRMGLGERADPDLDAFADRLADIAGAPYAMVNFIDTEGQFFAGLHIPPPARHSTARHSSARPAPRPEMGRAAARDHGFCPHVVARRKALALEDVRDYPRFAGNPVVDEFGIRSYLGAPLIDSTGMVLGTLCVEDVQPRTWGLEGLETIKSAAADLAARVERRHADGFAL